MTIMHITQDELPLEYPEDVEYVNEDCPAECNGEHETPEPDYDGQWACPVTEEVFCYTGPNASRGFANMSNWSGTNRWGYLSESRLLGDWWYDIEELFYCDSCDEYLHQDDYGGEGMCAHHYREYEREQEYDEDDEYLGDSDTTPTCAAQGCNSHDVVAYHVITEGVYCALHVSKMARENRRPIPQVPVAA